MDQTLKRTILHWWQKKSIFSIFFLNLLKLNFTSNFFTQQYYYAVVWKYMRMQYHLIVDGVMLKLIYINLNFKCIVRDKSNKIWKMKQINVGVEYCASSEWNRRLREGFVIPLSHFKNVTFNLPRVEIDRPVHSVRRPSARVRTNARPPTGEGLDSHTD